MHPEIWMLSFTSARELPRLARQAEDHGWDGLLVADSQNLTGDPYAVLTMAATVTDTLGLGTGVTNPVTRHPAVTAAAIATVQQYSGGRAVLGIGRGDSALSHLGRRPAAVPDFEAHLRHLQRYLAGQPVDLDGYPSRMSWITDTGLPKVPVDVAATGPKAIAAGARVADRLSFTVGADPDRVRWAIGVARQARAEAGLDPDAISFGAYVNAVCHPRPETAHDLVAGSLSVFARFSGMQRGGTHGLASTDRAAVNEITDAYDAHGHATLGSGRAALRDPAFVDRFAVIGTPEHCVRRLTALLDTGLTHLVIAGHSRDADPELLAEASKLFAAEVIPALHAAEPPRG
ncbi:LLM class flavin-dependent oxidoreductase [Pseudonocardia acaciae]|uniref:LLM class flavin-dependent oxidoreductase n=1 Tax=Pseudonocardia acaciae TaxID=551276 RepID=UPI0006890017|nr:LLM class flavin-dependent oxidoreductase [Pseudonocardia acaciae]